MMRFSLSLLLAVGMALTLAAEASAGLMVFTADLTPGQETPPVASPSFGTGTFVFDDVAMTLTFDIQWGATIGAPPLVAPLTVAHFHAAPIGVAGGIVRGFTPAEGAVPGIMSGTISGIWTPADAMPLSPAQVANLLAGNIYANIHSSMFPAGEIRGQLMPAGGGGAIPEPGSWALLGLGVAGLLGYGWRRRK